MAHDGYTTILHTTDPTQGELFAEMLRREGIEARFHQVRGTMIGMPANLIEMTVDVPTETEARARELLADLEYVGAAEASEQQAGDQGADDEPQGDAELAARDRIETGGLLRSRRHPAFAVSFALFLPGGAHLYARRPWTALVLALGVVGCFAIGLASIGSVGFEAAFIVWPMIVLCDAVGGVRAARADLRGERPSRLAQLARGLGLVCLAAVAGGAVGVLPKVPAMRSAAQFEKLQVSCTGDAIVIANRSSESWALDLGYPQVAAFSEFGRQIYDIDIAGPHHLTLAPGERGTFKPAPADWLSQSCRFSPERPETETARLFGGPLADGALPVPVPRPIYCGYLFSVVAQMTGDPLKAFGSCVPATSTHAETVARLELAR